MVRVSCGKPVRFRHSAFAFLEIRPAAAQHSERYEWLLRGLARGRCAIVEFGVAEGGSAVALRVSMCAQGNLWLVVPFFTGRVPGLCVARIVARRVGSSVNNGQVHWIRATSQEAGKQWKGPRIDLLFIDADHNYEAVREDWRVWIPHVAEDGIVSLDDAGPEARVLDGPRRLVEEQVSKGAGGWSVVEVGERYVALERKRTAFEAGERPAMGGRR